MQGPDFSEKMMVKPRLERQGRASQAKRRGRHVPEGRREHGERHAARPLPEAGRPARSNEAESKGRGSGGGGRGRSVDTPSPMEKLAFYSEHKRTGF